MKIAKNGWELIEVFISLWKVRDCVFGICRVVAEAFVFVFSKPTCTRLSSLDRYYRANTSNTLCIKSYEVCHPPKLSLLTLPS